METRDLSLAQMCGNRCKSIRMVKGMTQQELAEKLNVTPAAVSKWEKEGVSNIDQIKAISDALGQDITADQFDQEGTVGAVGKEILSILVKNGGNADYAEILSKLFGMKSDRLNNELFKLERIGAIVREQYVDFTSDERDAVFITAKGVIISKTASKIKKKYLNNVETIDQILSDKYISIQDFVDSERVTALLIKIGNEGKSYRCDYIFYLMWNFFNPGVTNNKFYGNMFRNIGDTCDLLLGKTAYIDILCRMAQSASREEIDRELEDSIRLWKIDDAERNKEILELATGLDKAERDAIKYFKTWLCHDESPIDNYDEAEIVENYKKDTGIKEKEFEEAVKIYPDYFERIADHFMTIPEENHLNVSKWFTEDEIRDFITKNILEAKTDYEKKIDDILHQIWKENELTLDYYYSFPKSWEENGLAQLVRDKVGVPPRKPDLSQN